MLACAGDVGFRENLVAVVGDRISPKVRLERCDAFILLNSDLSIDDGSFMKV